MKTVILLYITSLLSLFAAILLVVYYPESGRMNMIAGGLTMLGLTLNIVSFLMKKGAGLKLK